MTRNVQDTGELVRLIYAATLLYSPLLPFAMKVPDPRQLAYMTCCAKFRKRIRQDCMHDRSKARINLRKTMSLKSLTIMHPPFD